MSTLVENVQKVKNAHAALKTAIAAKGVAVPDGTKLTDMPALVEQIPAAPAQTTDINFYQDSGRTDMVVPGVIYVDFTKAININSCFLRCTSLTSLTLPEGFGMNATNINSCFLRCSALTSLTLPEGFGMNAIAANLCFSYCTSLTSLTLPEGFGMNVKNVNSCFSNCSALTSLTLPEGFGMNAIAVNLCFSNCTSLKSLTLPEGFGMNAKNVNSCFSNCTSLTSLTLPEGFGQNMTAASDIFYNCEAMVSLHLPAGFGQKVKTRLNRVFNGCYSLETITGNPVFNVSLILSESPKLTHDSLMVVINGLQTVTTTQTLTLGSTNLAKLTEADKKIATDKGWTLA